MNKQSVNTSRAVCFYWIYTWSKTEALPHPIFATETADSFEGNLIFLRALCGRSKTQFMSGLGISISKHDL